MILNKKDFKNVVKNAPLLAVDLLLRDSDGKILLGLRTNNPAKDYWFAPGGRIRKNEKISDAIIRIAKDEINININISKLNFLSVFEQFYEENCFEEQSYGTHYVTLLFEYYISDIESISVDAQHEKLEWFTIKQISENNKID
jgi:colanic acid biosynthesis protein WcaH